MTALWQALMVKRMANLINTQRDELLNGGRHAGPAPALLRPLERRQHKVF